MAELFNITHDAGNLDEYDSTVIDGGDLSAHVDAAMGGSSHGLKCVIDDATIIYGELSRTWPGSKQIRYRFYFNANDFAGDDYDSICLVKGNYWGGSTWFHSATIGQRSDRIRLILYATWDDSWDYHIVDPLPVGIHYAEVHVEQANTNVSADGRIRWWLDGELLETWENVDNFDHCANLSFFRVGASQVAAGTSGTHYVDEFKANDDGSEIGAISVADGISGMAMGMKVVRT